MPTPLLDRVSLGGMNAFYWLLSFGAAGFSMWFAIQYSTNRFFVPPAAPSYPYGQVHPVLHEGHCEGPRDTPRASSKGATVGRTGAPTADRGAASAMASTRRPASPFPRATANTCPIQTPTTVPSAAL